VLVWGVQPVTEGRGTESTEKMTDELQEAPGNTAAVLVRVRQDGISHPLQRRKAVFPQEQEEFGSGVHLLRGSMPGAL
jgi:hypothetical protein